MTTIIIEAPSEAAVAATVAAEPKRTVNMYLTPRRVRALGYTLPRQFVMNYAQEFPDPVRVTKTFMRKLTTFSWAHNVTWDNLAHGLLTRAGYDQYLTAWREVTRDFARKNEVARYRIDVNYLKAKIAWCTTYNKIYADYYDLGDRAQEARDASNRIEHEYREAGRVANTRYAQRSAELICDFLEHTRDAYRRKPRQNVDASGNIIITSDTLRALGSCDTYVERFQHLFPEGSVITEDVCVEHFNSFDWHWAAMNLLASDLVNTWDNNVHNARRTEVDPRRTRDGDAYAQRVRELATYEETGLITHRQRMEKERQYGVRFSRNRHEFENDNLRIQAREFARLYAQQPSPRLPELTTD